MKESKFKPGDKVFAKVRGFPHWPAVIENIDLTTKLPKYEVLFYGTQESASVKETDVCLYLENKARFGQTKTNIKNKNKNKVFLNACREIELSFSRNLTLKKSFNDTSNKSSSYDDSIIQNLRNSMQIPNASSSPNVHTTKHLTNEMIKKVNKQLSCSKTMEKGSDNGTTSPGPQLKNREINTDSNMSLCLSVLQLDWLTDSALQFYFNLLTTKVIKPDIYLMNPVIAQAIKCLEDTDDLITPLDLQSKSYIIIPINDASRVDTLGGTHWSLLLYIKDQQSYYYFDSLHSHNYKHAQVVANKVSKYLSACSQKPTLSIEQVPVPQQNNTFDCGIYVLLFTDTVVEAILTQKLSIPGIELSNLFSSIEESDVLTKRAQLAFLLLNNQINLTTYTITSMMFHKKKYSEDDPCNLVGSHKLKRTKKYEQNVNSPHQNMDTSNTSKWIQVKNKKLSMADSKGKKTMLARNSKNQNKQEEPFKKSSPKPTLYVVGDSHARDMASILISELSPNYNVTSSCYPGAPMLYVVEQLMTTSHKWKKMT